MEELAQLHGAPLPVRVVAADGRLVDAFDGRLPEAVCPPEVLAATFELRGVLAHEQRHAIDAGGIGDGSDGGGECVGAGLAENRHRDVGVLGPQMLVPVLGSTRSPVAQEPGSALADGLAELGRHLFEQTLGHPEDLEPGVGDRDVCDGGWFGVGIPALGRLDQGLQGSQEGLAGVRSRKLEEQVGAVRESVALQDVALDVRPIDSVGGRGAHVVGPSVRNAAISVFRSLPCWVIAKPRSQALIDRAECTVATSASG